jgi:hypothetical protein
MHKPISRAIILVLSVFAFALALSAPAGAISWGFADGDINSLQTAARAAGSGSTIRLDASFSSSHPDQNTYNWGNFDWYSALIEQAGPGDQWLPILTYNADWNGGLFHGPNTDTQRFWWGLWAQQFASRYKGHVRAYEIWNEPNLPRYWTQGPNAVEYAKLFDKAYNDIRAVDPTTPIIMGGICDCGDWQTYLSTFWNNVQNKPNGITIHPYNRTSQINWLQSHYVSTPVYVTETGIAVAAGDDRAVRAPFMAGQRQAIINLDNSRASAGGGRVKVAIGYSWNDPEWALSYANQLVPSSKAWLGQPY